MDVRDLDLLLKPRDESFGGLHYEGEIPLIVLESRSEGLTGKNVLRILDEPHRTPEKFILSLNDVGFLSVQRRSR